MTENATSRSKSHTSRFEYVENAPSVRNRSEDNQMIGHVAPPKSSNFFAEFGMDTGYHKKPIFSSSKVQVIYVLSNNCIVAKVHS
jgi:ADP-ribosylation factor GTPase-activating protein 2/3